MPRGLVWSDNLSASKFPLIRTVSNKENGVDPDFARPSI